MDTRVRVGILQERLIDVLLRCRDEPDADAWTVVCGGPGEERALTLHDIVPALDADFSLAFESLSDIAPRVPATEETSPAVLAALAETSPTGLVVVLSGDALLGVYRAARITAPPLTRRCIELIPPTGGPAGEPVSSAGPLSAGDAATSGDGEGSDGWSAEHEPLADADLWEDEGESDSDSSGGGWARRHRPRVSMDGSSAPESIPESASDALDEALDEGPDDADHKAPPPPNGHHAKGLPGGASSQEPSEEEASAGLGALFDEPTPVKNVLSRIRHVFTRSRDKASAPPFPLESADLALPAETPPAFEAYPRLDAPAHSPPGEEFDIIVGFRGEHDTSLAQGGVIRIAAPTRDARMRILVSGENVEFIGERVQSIPLKHAAAAHFRARLTPGASEAIINASYAYQGNVVGFASRLVRGASGPASVATALAPISFGDPESAVDATLHITRAGARGIEWQLITPTEELGPFLIALEEPRKYAQTLVRLLERAADRTKFAKNALDSVARDIAEHVPRDIITALAKLARDLQRPPNVLLLTQEFYIPWELAHMPDPPDPTSAPVLGAQACIGRWLLQNGVETTPPARIEVSVLTAIASEYGQGTGKGLLKHALEEQDYLATRHRAERVEATVQAILGLIDPPTRGRLMHFAVHGASVPDATDAAIALADYNTLTADALAGYPTPDEPPSAAFVFLNACQVGMANDGLGQAIGFPGRLLEGRVGGFLAPLWKVADDEAHRVATRFYDETLDGDRRPVSAVLRETRAPYTKDKSLTILAYTYYGHPMLRFHRAP